MRARKTLTRRTILAGSTAAATAVLAAPVVAQGEQRTFVLVHGAWHGGWCWRRVADRLEKRGHKVYAPSLTGLADRAHLLTGRVNVTTHITDIVSLIRFEDLRNIVLVGHSYAGFVISGVAEQAHTAIASVVFLDAFVPQNGQSIFSISSDRLKQSIIDAQKRGQLGMAPAPAAYFNVNEKDRAFVDSKCTPQPIGTYVEPLTLTGARERIARKTYIRATGFKAPGFDAAVERLRGDASWRLRELPCGHDAMIDMPDEVTAMLSES
jgi:pimeloyl-ACP methyl ester carboxylesterase